MSRPASRKHTSPPSVQRRRQPDPSGTAPSSIPPFLTQLEDLDLKSDLSSSIIEDTQTIASGRRLRAAARTSRAVASTTASRTHRSEDRTERADSSRQGHSGYNLSIPQGTDPNSRSLHIDTKGKQAAAEVSSALNDAPPPELLAAQRDLLELWTEEKGLPAAVVYRGVIQATNSYFPNLKWGQSEPTRSQRNTTGVDVETTERLSDPDSQTTALTLDVTHESQHGSQSSRDTAGGIDLDKKSASSLHIAPGKEDQIERVAAVPANKKGKNKAAPKLTLGDMRVTINSEEEFRDAFLDLNLDSIRAGSLVIDLLELARKTVEDVKPKFQQRLRDAEEQERQQMTGARGKRNNRMRRVDATKEVWQVLFTIIANVFVLGLEPLFETVDASSKPTIATGCSGRGRASPTNITTDSNTRNRRNTESSGNGVAGRVSGGTPFGSEGMKKLRLGMRNMHSKKDSAQKRLNRVYDYYDHLQAVNLYDSMLKAWREEEDVIQCALWEEFEDYQGQDAATVILSYVCQEEETMDDFRFLSEDSEDIRSLSEMIFGLRPVCSLVEAFGEGVILLLVDNAEKFALGKVGALQEHYPQHERIRDVALSLCKVDRERYEGNLHQQFTMLEEKVLRPVLQFRKGGNTRKLLLDCPQKEIFDMEHVGERISFILTCVGRRNGSHSDVRTVQQGLRRSKRRMPHSSMEQSEDEEHGDDGEQGRDKRYRTGSNEDDDSRIGWSESGSDDGDGLYSS